MAATCLGRSAFTVEQAQQAAAHGHQYGEAGGAAQTQADQANAQRTQAVTWVVGQCGHPKKSATDKGELRQDRTRFVRQQGQPQAGNQGQHGTVGHGAGVVFGFGFTAKGKSHGLRLWAQGQVVSAVPGAGQCHAQQHGKRQARCQTRRHPAGCNLNRPSAQPIGQKGVQIGCLPPDQEVEPAAAAFGQGQHLGKGGEFVAFPGFAANQTGQHIGGTKQPQGHTRQAANSTLGNDGGGRVSHSVRVWHELRNMGRKKGSSV